MKRKLRGFIHSGKELYQRLMWMKRRPINRIVDPGNCRDACPDNTDYFFIGSLDALNVPFKIVETVEGFARTSSAFWISASS